MSLFSGCNNSFTLQNIVMPLYNRISKTNNGIWYGKSPFNPTLQNPPAIAGLQMIFIYIQKLSSHLKCGKSCCMFIALIIRRCGEAAVFRDFHSISLYNYQLLAGKSYESCVCIATVTSQSEWDFATQIYIPRVFHPSPMS